MIDQFKRRTLNRVINQAMPVHMALVRFFFKPRNTYKTRTIQFDFVKGTNVLAPLVSPKLRAKNLERGKWITRTVVAPYIKTGAFISAQNLQDRNPGQDVYDQNVPSGAQYARQEILKEQMNIIDMIERRTEVMVHEILTTVGDVTFTGEGESITVNYGMQASHKVALTLTDKWSDTTNSDPIADLVTWSQRVSDDGGIAPNRCIMSAEAAKLYKAHPKVQAILDNRRIFQGEIRFQDLPDSLQYIGREEESGLDLFKYTGQYTNDSGTVTKVMTANELIIGYEGVQTEIAYGAIEDLAAPVRAKWFFKAKEEFDPSGHQLLGQSSPLPMVYNADNFLSAIVN